MARKKSLKKGIILHARTTETAKRRVEAEADRRSVDAPQSVSGGTIVTELIMKYLPPHPGEPKTAALAGAAILRAAG